MILADIGQKMWRRKGEEVKKAGVGRELWCGKDRFYTEKEAAMKYGPKVDFACDERVGRGTRCCASPSICAYCTWSFGMLVRVCNYAYAPGLGY